MSANGFAISLRISAGDSLFRVMSSCLGVAGCFLFPVFVVVAAVLPPSFFMKVTVTYCVYSSGWLHALVVDEMSAPRASAEHNGVLLTSLL